VIWRAEMINGILPAWLLLTFAVFPGVAVQLLPTGVPVTVVHPLTVVAKKLTEPFPGISAADAKLAMSSTLRTR